MLHNTINKTLLNKEIIRHRSFYLFLLPAMIVVAIFNYIPMFGLVMAFQDFDIVKGFQSSPFIGLDNFIKLFQDSDFFLSVRNTLAMNGLFILIGFPLPIILALIINEVKAKSFKKVMQSISYLPHFVSWVVVAGMAYKILEPDNGILNILLTNVFGMDSIPFLRESEYFWGIMVSSSIWKELGWNSIIFLAALAGIDPQLYEAAVVDGANKWKQLWYITLPSIAPVIVLMFIFTIAKIFGGAGGGSGISGITFDAIYNMANPLVMDRGINVDFYIYLEGIRSAHYALAAAAGFVLSTISFTILLMVNRISRRFFKREAF